MGKKYNRFEKRHKNMSVHLSPCFRDVKTGDVATVGECRPLSKTVKFNTLKITRASGSKKSFIAPTHEETGRGWGLHFPWIAAGYSNDSNDSDRLPKRIA